MPSLLPILFYPDFFTQNFTLLDLKKAAGETPRLLLSLKGEEETVLPRSPLCRRPLLRFCGCRKCPGAFHPAL